MIPSIACGALALGALMAGACRGDPREGACPYEDAEAVANEGWQHVTDEGELQYDHNPPASGPHFAQWASYGIHDDVVPRGNWVHNLEHGAVVLLIGPDASEDDRADLHDAFDAVPIDDECDHNRVIVTEDPELDARVAAVAADIVMEGSSLEVDDIVDFATACRNRAPENICY